MKRIFWIISFCLLAASKLSATTWYVAKTGNDTNNDCTEAQNPATPKLTIASAFGCVGTSAGAGAGDTVEVAVGTYTESMTQNLPSGTSWGSPFTLQGKSGDTVTIMSSSANNIAIYDTRSMYLIIQNFVFDGTNTSNTQIMLAGGGSGPSHIKILNNQIINTEEGNGIYISEFSTDIQVTNNIIHDGGFLNGGSNSQGHNHAVYVTGNNCIIEGNTMYNLPAFGVHQYSGHTPPPANNVIRNNRIYNFGLLGIAAGIYLDSGAGSVAYNNIVYQTAANGNAVGITVKAGSSAYNNTVYNNGYIGIEVPAGNTARNNIAYQNGVNISAGGTLSNNYTSNPSFVNAASQDFHISAGSGVIGFGCSTAPCTTTLSALYTTDFDGNARGTHPWDAGAYEYGTPPDSMTVNAPTSASNWTIGSSQTAIWTCVGCNGTGIDIKEDQDNNGSYETTIVSNTANDGSHTFTVSGSAGSRKLQICDTDAAPCGVSATYTVSSSSGGTITTRISQNTVGTKVGNIPGVEDNFMWSLSPASNYGSDSTLYVGKAAAADHTHGLIRFTGLSQIPSNATLTSVTLGLWVQDGSATSQTIDLRRLLRNWSVSSSSWNEYSSGNAWTTAGGLGAATDRVDTAVGQITGVGPTNQYYTVTSTGTLKTFFQNIVSGSAANEGLHLEDTTQDDGYLGFTSSDGLDGQRPYLEVTYTTSSATITISEPKTGDLFLSGQSGPARWTSDGISGNVRIDLSRDSGSSWETLVASTPYDAADISLTYQYPTSSNCKIRVVSLNDTNIIGTSGTFRIGGTRAGFLLVP